MDINQLRCFVAVGKELHFGRAAQSMEMMPASLSRFIRLLEEDLGVRLLNRSTRNVSLTAEGALFFDEAGKLIDQFDALALRFKGGLKDERRTLRIGAIDSAARGLVPALLNLFVPRHPLSDIHIIEDKTLNLIPKLKSGWLDMIIIRAPQRMDASLALRFITRESCVLAVPLTHPLADKAQVTVADFQHEAMIIPDRRTRPHSHDLTISLFKQAGLTPHIAQYAEEKQTILSLVSAGLGLAVVPASYRTMNSDSVRYIPLTLPEQIKGLPLSIAWQKGNEDPLLREMLRLLHDHRQELIDRL
ncbi:MULTISPECIES: LysR family transcriptional regulator [Pantoea]|uniref:LysR family transcriptional regulator n=1 Tax=Pantoea TaxID=53335 RepID=UPI0007367327|nr:LysR family transcriptional regulator [Pantoea dispersa]KTS35795.1 transcriptional regulator [Pantoea dispersa]KTS61533.1 transcriptional regulator [Pantoea dispersa]NIG14923.1 LysR family transcriptional regulator [Pantoea sp. Cy-640]UXO67921.1 LysR family transcriptional regulator [Pantoea dispersa]